MLQNSNSRQIEKTWTKEKVSIIVGIAILYSIWFDLLDSLVYCEGSPSSSNSIVDCKSIGEIFGGNQVYQPWNITGHLIPTLFMLFLKPIRIWYFLAAFLISTAVMDSPLWGVERLLWHGQPLWQQNHTPTYDFGSWIVYYYNPLGTYHVWDHNWLFPNFPTSSVIFWSLVARISAGVCILIWFQNKQEPSLQNLASRF
jgi:hypothetical protein